METNLHKYLLSYGIKPSVQRIAVMKYLMEHRTHPTADEIYVALNPSIPTLSKTTVYNTLKLLAAHGAVLLLDLDGRNARFDGDVSPHAHFLCRSCDQVFDMPLTVSAERLQIEPEGFEIDEVQVYYKGHCKACRCKKN